MKRKILLVILTIAALFFVAYLNYYARISTMSSPTVLDYDPWWFFRHAKEILENGFIVPKWDTLSYYPPGRPAEHYQGWPYTIDIFYEISRIFSNISFTDLAKLSPVIMAILAIFPAFAVGRLVSNNWGGVVTALFATLTPTFIGVSMAGYSDSDVVVVFHSFLSIFSIFLALKKRPIKKSIPFYILAILINLAFVFSWGRGWYILLFLTGFIPALLIFRLIEQIIHQRKFSISLTTIKEEVKSLIVPLLVIVIVTNVIGTLLNLSNIYNTLFGGLLFVSGQKLLVNISVAELQAINIFTKEGFNAVAGRVGLGPTLFTFFGLPFLILYKLIKKIKISYIEIFLLMWALITFYLITRGVRFSILFSIVTAISAGYVVGNFFTYFKKNIVRAAFFGITAVFVIMFISDAVLIGSQAGGMQISKNWYDMLDWLKANAGNESLIVTWWDPGHIITGYTGLKVMADGAHCGIGICIPYNHNIRIQDMGRAFSVSDENESIKILGKYRGLTTQQCQDVKKAFGDIVPEEACKQISDMYVIASSDLIQKYYWLSYFGTGTGKSFFQLPFTGYDQTQGVINYQNGLVSLVRKDDQWLPVYQNRYVIRDLVYFENGQMKQLTFPNATNLVDGMLWVDPGYGISIFMEPAIRDSIFTRMFFWNGQGLQHFSLVYINPEIRVFKVTF
jgi:dolichyl-diphosphooligosaccharide--protein glycosyltransferase